MSISFKIFLLTIVISTAVSGAFLSADETADTRHLHVIHSYSFDIPGKTSESALRREIIPLEGDAPFDSEEQLIVSLERKSRTLYNMRIFNSVSYTYEEITFENNVTYYHVNFFIDDSFTFLPIPYGKYNSNYGFRIGVKAYERNLFGSLANLSFVGHVSQSFDTELNDYTWTTKDYFTELQVNQISLGASKLNIFLRLDLRQKEDAFHNGNLETRFTWSNIKLFNNTFTHESLFFFNKADESSSPWELKEYRIVSSIGKIHVFHQPFHFYNLIRVIETDQTLQNPDIHLITSLTWLDLSFANHPYSVTFNSEQNISTKEIDISLNRFSTSIQSSFNFPLGFRYSPSAAGSLRMDQAFFIPHNVIISTSHVFSRGSIDWNENFREGSHFFMKVDANYSFNSDIQSFSDRFTSTARMEFTTFWIAAPWLNISTRTQGFIAHRPLDIEFPHFLPEKHILPAEQIRGILIRNFDDAPRKLGLTFNLNVTFLPIRIDGLAESFLTPFFDFGVFDTSAKNSISSDDLRFFYTGGLEAHVIFDRYRSFPFRASVGVNLQDLNKHLSGDPDMKFWDIEHEISISMDLFF